MKGRFKRRLITLGVALCLLALALYAIYLSQSVGGIVDRSDRGFIRNGGFEEGSLFGWGASVVGDPDGSAAAPVKYQPYSGEYCLVMMLDGRAKVLRVEPQIERIPFSWVKGFSLAYRLLNSSDIMWGVTFVLKGSGSNDSRTLVYLLYNEGKEYVYYNETTQLVFNIGDAGAEWRKIERRIVDDFKLYWVKDDPSQFTVSHISVDLYRAGKEQPLKKFLAFIDDFNLEK